MNNHFRDIIRTISKGDTTMVESFLKRPGGRKYLESLTLVLITALPQQGVAKEDLYKGFLEVLRRMELRIQRQKDGEQILEEAFLDS